MELVLTDNKRAAMRVSRLIWSRIAGAMAWRPQPRRWMQVYVAWAERVTASRPWLMPAVLALFMFALWFQLNGHGLPITTCQWR